MNYAVNFCANGLFGSYPFPANEKVTELRSIGVNVFINLTETNEKARDGTGLENYQEFLDDCEYINYPIKDMCAPQSIKSFHKFVSELMNHLNNKENVIYIHCRGGHGRAGLVVACLLISMGYTAEEALKLTNEYHSKRTDMSKKMRKLGSPQTRKQKSFVREYYKYFHGF